MDLANRVDLAVDLVLEPMDYVLVDLADDLSNRV